MREAWIRLQCPACSEHWESNPTDLPAPDREFACTNCDERRPTSEFMRTKRDLEILEAFHEA